MATRLPTSRECSVKGCANGVGSHGAKGMCRTHYGRLVRNGDPLIRHRIANGEAMKFIIEVALKHRSNRCLVWPFSKKGNGYGQIGSRTSSNIVCEAIHGPPPSPKHVAAHSCDNRICVAPRHVKWKTQRRNLIDAVERRRTPTTKLTPKIVRKMRRLDGTMPRRQIAMKFNIGVTQTHRILNRQSWAWLN